MSTFSMTNLIGRGSWTVLLPLYIGFFVLTWSLPASAAELKDVRVGEYKGFTRIVFELDEPAIKPDIQIQSSNHLLITFDKTIPNLVRHIPVERSPHVDDIQFWQRKSSLSMLLIFDYPSIRLESFRLSHPPRFAVDVFPVAEPVEEKSTAPVAPDQIAPKDYKNKTSKTISKQTSVSIDTQSESISEPSDKGPPSKLSEATVSPSDTNQPSDDNSPSSEHGKPTPYDMDNRTPNALTKKSAPSPMLTSASSESTLGIKQNTDKIEQKTPSPNNRLQFYLVIILVIITIAILLLLLLMVLSRNQLFYDKEAINTAEIAQHQDKNILAELDSDLKEHLKRYDEA